MTKLRYALAATLVGAALAGGAHAAEEAAEPIDIRWPHEGIFGAYDRAMAQRGFQVYREVCAGCHGMSYIAFRNLLDLGFTEPEVRAIASEYTVTDGPDEFGDMFEREAVLSDYIPSPYPNEQAARAANGGAYPPDLSLIAKARPNGSDYLYSLMLGYVDDPSPDEAPVGMYYNAYYPGHYIAMPQPIWPDGVSYADGTSATIEQQAADLTVFLSWAAEPKLEERKQTGVKAMIFLVVLSGLLYATKRKVWADVEH